MSRVHRVTSFDKFSAELERRQPEFVAVQASRMPARGLFRTSMTGSVGRLGDYDHGLLYVVGFPKKQRQHREHLFTSFQSEYGLADNIERNKRVMAVLLAGEIRVGQLGLMLAGTEVYLSEPNLEPMSEERLELLHEQALEYDVTAPPFIT